MTVGCREDQAENSTVIEQLKEDVMIVTMNAAEETRAQTTSLEQAMREVGELN